LPEIVTGMTIAGHVLAGLLYDGGDGRKVFLTCDAADDDRPAVIKLAPLPDEPGATRLGREFGVLRQLAGTSVAAASSYGASLQHRCEYLVLAAHGPSLDAVLAAAPGCQLSASAGLAMAHAIATSLGQLHSRGWCHGDLKPGNVLCDRTGIVQLTDLEFAVSHAAPADHDLQLQRGGTPPFMAPELWNTSSHAKTPATDIWSLGVTLYLALFGDYPFGSGDSETIREAIDHGLPPERTILPSDVPTGPARRTRSPGPQSNSAWTSQPARTSLPAELQKCLSTRQPRLADRRWHLKCSSRRRK
jgi:serine/threonine protein kinase